ncbi:ADP-ribosylglycohydrolase [Chitinophaga terrae (ex Kim and Jung 2007)]|uniref:ADP-ribosylglycohydrolase family protein n=1 Tax=Chitinophaga terrae (ex Kim and Jung 2007) TaxID=408074 RepID=UPI002784934A|nr:ADP-ribosylglycohydrolase family protein [Chitinophaga terrae (ex Kim and Jung 2007)]MDQ0109029.1 ADP-ribosylglycohydrolase [Chitinophaga terrae (ex Kim and Jung 2007)]
MKERSADKNPYKDILFGIAIGDALGVPVEFMSREAIAKDPVTDMRGFGTHNQPPGTFSDDSSLAFCLAEALAQPFDLQTTADNFVKWLNEAYWTARGSVFDIGIATHQAIQHLARGCKPELAGGMDVSENGNGSLMRILPLLMYIKDKPVQERYELAKKVSAITHGHIRSVIACFYYLEFARYLLQGQDKFQVYQTLKKEIPAFLRSISINPEEIRIFQRLLEQDIFELKESQIHSSGYVLHTLEASTWCLLTTGSYSDATLKAVNLGSDTDTTGAVTGGLAGLLYGWKDIPAGWVEKLARKNEIEDLAERMELFLEKDAR